MAPSSLRASPSESRQISRTSRHLDLEPLELRLCMSAATDLLSQVPLQFEPNHGQTDAQVRFLSRGPGYSLFLTDDKAVLSLASENEDPVALEMSLLGANSHPQVVGLDRQAGYSNYFKGHGADVTGVEHYARVEYKQVYPGVDLVYYGTNQRQLEYDFVLSPGADPSAIRIQFQGTTGMEIDGSGQLVLHTSGGDVVEHAPITYQSMGGQRQHVASQYVMHDGQVGIQVGAYDPSRELVIDPVLGYSSYLGGSGVDKALAVAAGPKGTVFVTGLTTSADFPMKGALKGSKSAKDNQDAFVTKFDTTQSGKDSIVFSTYLGGSSGDAGQGIAVNDLGQAFVVGWTDSLNDFPTGNGVPGFQKAGNAARSGFLVQLSENGSKLLYSSYIHSKNNASTASTEASGVALVGNLVAVVGKTAEDDLQTDNGFQTKRQGGTDAFIMDLDPMKDGSASFRLGSYLGGSGDDGATAIATGFLGSVWVTGYTQSHDGKNSTGFPVTVDALQKSLPGTQHAFVCRIDGPSTDFVPLSLGFSSYLGGTGGIDIGYSIAVNPMSDCATIGGATNSNDFPTSANPNFKFDFSSYHDALVGTTDGFVVQVESHDLVNAKFVYSSFLGGQSPGAAVYGVAVDQAGNVYATGAAGHNLQAIGPQMPGSASGDDAFLVRFDSTGQMNYSSRLGGGDVDWANGIAVSTDGFVYFAGQTSSKTPTPFPTTATAFQQALGGSPESSLTDGFLSRVDLDMLVGAGSDQFKSPTAGLAQDIIFRDAGGSTSGFDIRLSKKEDRSMDQQFPHRSEGEGQTFGQPMRQDTGHYEMDSAEIPVAPPAKNSPFPSSSGAVAEWKALFRNFWSKNFDLAQELASFARY